MARTKLLFGNWKMNKTIAESRAFAEESKKLLAFANEKGVEIGVAPVYLSLQAVKETNPALNVAAENCHFEDHGAFTGEIAIPMLKAFCCRFHRFLQNKFFFRSDQ